MYNVYVLSIVGLQQEGNPIVTNHSQLIIYFTLEGG